MVASTIRIGWRSDATPKRDNNKLIGVVWKRSWVPWMQESNALSNLLCDRATNKHQLQESSACFPTSARLAIDSSFGWRWKVGGEPCKNFQHRGEERGHTRFCFHKPGISPYQYLLLLSIASVNFRVQTSPLSKFGLIKISARSLFVRSSICRRWSEHPLIIRVFYACTITSAIERR